MVVAARVGKADDGIAVWELDSSWVPAGVDRRGHCLVEGVVDCHGRSLEVGYMYPPHLPDKQGIVYLGEHCRGYNSQIL